MASEPDLNAHKARSSLRNGLISLAVLVAMATGLLLAIPGLQHVQDAVSDINPGWLVVAVVLEILSCLGYVVAFLYVFDRAPIRFGARVALAELAFGAAVSVGGVGSIAVGAWLLVDRGAPPARVAERSVVLFLLTSAINVLTLAAAGLILFTGIVPGSTNALLSLVPGVAGVAVFVFFLILPRIVGRIAAGTSAGRIRTLLIETARSIDETRRLLTTPN
jgi:hypothetical protein